MWSFTSVITIVIKFINSIWLIWFRFSFDKVGGKSQYASGAAQLYSKMDKSKSSFIKFDDVNDVLTSAPRKLAESMLLFVKGKLWMSNDLKALNKFVV